MIGKVYNIPPQPPVAENTRYLRAGALTFGIEYRELDPASLVATYQGNAAHLAELQEKSPEGGFTDEGVSIHVCNAADGREYVRFDVFDDEPHYHYVHHDGDEIVNNVIDFDTAAHGEMLPWAIDVLRNRLPAMLTEAGAADLAAKIDRSVIAPVVDEVAQLATRAQKAHREAARP